MNDRNKKRYRRDGLKRREQIMSVSVKLFAEKGYNNTALDDIIASADIAKGTFYLHFTNKFDLFYQIIDTNLEVIYNYVKVLDISSVKTVDETRELYVNVIQTIVQIVEVRLFAKILLKDVIGQEQAIVDRVQKFYDKIVDMSTTYIGKAQQIGRVKTNIDARNISLCILGCIKETLYRLVVLDEKIDIAKIVTDYLELYLYGILTTQSTTIGLDEEPIN